MNHLPLIKKIGQEFLISGISERRTQRNGVDNLLPVNLHERVLTAKSFIEQNPHLSLSLKDMSDKAFVSEYHFLRLFKQVFDVTPYQYQLDIRLAYAKQLLESTSSSIEDIAFSCGFSNVATFGRAYKKRYFASPSRDRCYNQVIIYN